MDGAALVVIAVFSLALLGALVEWRLWRNREALRAWERDEHQKVIDTLTSTIREAMRDAVAEAMRLERDNGQAIDMLSEHVSVLEADMAEVKKRIGWERPPASVASLERGIEIPKSPEGQPSQPTPESPGI